MDIEPKSKSTESQAQTESIKEESNNTNVDPEDYQPGSVGQDHLYEMTPSSGELKTPEDEAGVYNNGELIERKQLQANMIENFVQSMAHFFAFRQDYQPELIPSAPYQLDIQETFSDGGLTELELKNKRLCASLGIDIDRVAALFPSMEKKSREIAHNNYHIEKYKNKLGQQEDDKVETKAMRQELKRAMRGIKRRRFIDDEATESRN